MNAAFTTQSWMYRSFAGIKIKNKFFSRIGIECRKFLLHSDRNHESNSKYVWYN